MNDDEHEVELQLERRPTRARRSCRPEALQTRELVITGGGMWPERTSSATR